VVKNPNLLPSLVYHRSISLNFSSASHEILLKRSWNIVHAYGQFAGCSQAQSVPVDEGGSW